MSIRLAVVATCSLFFLSPPASDQTSPTLPVRQSKGGHSMVSGHHHVTTEGIHVSGRAEGIVAESVSLSALMLTRPGVRASTELPGSGRRGTEGDALRPEMLERVAWHRSEGHEIVIAPSLDVYTSSHSTLLGVHDHVFCTRLGIGANDRLNGLLEGGNVRGPEKVRRIRSLAQGGRGRAVGVRRQRRRPRAARGRGPPPQGRSAQPVGGRISSASSRGRRSGPSGGTRSTRFASETTR